MTSTPFSAPLAVTYTFAVAPGAPPVAGDYRVRVWFRSQDGALLWSDDHAPPTPVAEWAPGTTVTYTRERFLPRVPYIGPVAIDVAIEVGLGRVEAGAQGGHKLARGYEPVETHSAHWIADPGFREAIADFLERESAGVAADRNYLARRTPFRRGE